MDLACGCLSSSFGSGAGLILAFLEGDVVEYSMRFDFSTINNEIEYKALIAGLKIIKGLGVRYLTTFSNSQLVVWQIKDEYEAQEENTKKYHGKAKDVTASFQGFDIRQLLE